MRFSRETFMKNRDKLREDLLRLPVFHLVIKHKESLKDYFVKNSEELIMKSGKNSRNYIVRFPEELFMKNRVSLSDDFLRIAAMKSFMEHKESLKDDFVKISEELAMKIRDGFAKILLKLSMKHRESYKRCHCEDFRGVIFEIEK